MKTVLISQGLHNDKIIASIIRNRPEKVVFIRSAEDWNEDITDAINRSMEKAREYLNKQFSLYKAINYDEHRVNFFELPDALKSLYEKFREEKEIMEAEGGSPENIIVDLSSGPPLISVAMFLAAQFVGLNRIEFGFSGKRFLNIKEKDIEQEMSITRKEIEFSEKSRILMPHLPLKPYPIPFDILTVIANSNKKKIHSLQDLVSKLGGDPRSNAHLMSVSRNLKVLQKYGYISDTRVGKRREVQITDLGIQMLSLKGSEIGLEIKTRIK